MSCFVRAAYDLSRNIVRIPIPNRPLCQCQTIWRRHANKSCQSVPCVFSPSNRCSFSRLRIFHSVKIERNGDWMRIVNAKWWMRMWTYDRFWSMRKRHAFAYVPCTRISQRECSRCTNKRKMPGRQMTECVTSAPRWPATQCPLWR